MDIIEIVPGRIYSIKYDGEDVTEYYRLFNEEWTDVDYLLGFFQSHPEFTENEFWGFLGNDPEIAAARVVEDANKLEPYLKELAENSDNGEQPDLETYFKPINGKYGYGIRNKGTMGFNLNRLKEVAKQASEKERDEAKFREENRDWLLKSALIALEIHRYLRLNGMTQSQLAEKLGISPAMVTKLLSGKENLSLKTICSIERVIQFELLNIPSYEKGAFVKFDLSKTPDENLEFENHKAFCKVIKMNAETETKKRAFAV